MSMLYKKMIKVNFSQSINDLSDVRARFGTFIVGNVNAAFHNNYRGHGDRVLINTSSVGIRGPEIEGLIDLALTIPQAKQLLSSLDSIIKEELLKYNLVESTHNNTFFSEDNKQEFSLKDVRTKFGTFIVGDLSVVFHNNYRGHGDRILINTSSTGIRGSEKEGLIDLALTIPQSKQLLSQLINVFE